MVELCVYNQINEIRTYYNLKSSKSSVLLPNGEELLSIGENINNKNELVLSPYGVYSIK